MSDRPMFVMFDLDGTLVDTSALYLTGVPLMAERHLGAPVDVSSYMDLWGHDVRRWFERAAGGRQDVAGAMYADFEAFYIANHHTCPVYAGVAEGLACLKDAGHTVGVVTTRPQRRADLVYEHGWASALDFVVGGDRVARRKPFPDSLDFAIEQFAGRRRDGGTVYGGDNIVDVQAARASRHGVVSVAALWGTRDRASLVAARPDHSFEQFSGCACWLTAGTDSGTPPAAARAARSRG